MVIEVTRGDCSYAWTQPLFSNGHDQHWKTSPTAVKIDQGDWNSMKSGPKAGGKRKKAMWITAGQTVRTREAYKNFKYNFDSELVNKVWDQAHQDANYLVTNAGLEDQCLHILPDNSWILGTSMN